MCHVSDSFLGAIRTLAGDGPVKQRLADAYSHHLEGLREDEIPEPVAERFEALRRAMTAVRAARGEDAVQVSVRKMAAADAARQARLIVAIFAELVQTKSIGSGDDSANSEAARSPRPFTAIEGGLKPPGFLARQ